MLQTTDFLLIEASSSQREEINKYVSQSVDAIALLGHLTGNISSLRRSTMRPLLRPEYQPLCSSITEIPRGPYLFGEDLNKQLKEAEQSNKVAKAFKGNPKNRYKQQPFLQSPSQQNNASRYFYGGAARINFGKSNRTRETACHSLSEGPTL